MPVKDNIAISESGFLFDANSGDSYSVNKTGRLILKLINEGKNQHQIAEAVLDEYEIEPQLLSHYIEDFFQMLYRYDLLDKE